MPDEPATGRRYVVRVDTAALREIRKLPRDVGKQAQAAINSLTLDPRPSGCRKLSGSASRYRIKVAHDYRIVYDVDDSVITVSVVRVAHRRSVYRSR